ncbi:MAG: bifunctional 5,10-methylenetetrahydrofolate dehydrogenase/5,10-methenyltetrahydrofolate cyclohydrolase [Candidatus Pacebacteria bacterium]|nr:bifunctional 5,10-methylenetetrahydrofolate dehydrogenase/5,10-methenyltetrahydrofolate cyclohydrolase [Candidatus Paceibacterota bacterium]
MRIDGKELAGRVYAQLLERRKTVARAPRLGIIVGGNDPVIESFVRIKSRAANRLDVELVRVDLGEHETTDRAIAAIRTLAIEVDGIIVQLPLPGTLDVNAVLSVIPDDKDIDSISTATPEHAVDAPVAGAIAEILHQTGVDPKGKQAVVVGAGRLVGNPAVHLLERLGANVSSITLEQGSLDDLKMADIVVCGAGNPGFIKPEHLKPGVVLLDAGTSEQSGKVVGDCDPSCEAIASVFTPVPGGIGPVAIAMIFKNLLDLIEAKKK